MKKPTTEQVLDVGYETLFLLGGFLAVSAQPTRRNQEQFFHWLGESQSRREHLRRLRKRGLIASGGDDEDWVPRLTKLGASAFAGGRDPEAAWNRTWDGTWRLLTFDLPRGESRARMKFRRWLCTNHFGRLQGSVWISPDPVPSIAEVITNDRLDPTMVMVFEGGLAGSPRPREVAALAWDFDSINSSYRRYASSATRVLQQLRRKAPSRARFREILRKDRIAWWSAVRMDPLLPKALLPEGYEGPATWRIRGRLLKQLGKTLDVTSLG